MSRLALSLERHHYIVINKDYPSTSKSIREIANDNLPAMINECLKHNPHSINFVTHSLGGIILQEYLQNHKIAKLGSIVMLGPPNHGSPIVNLLQNNWLYRVITGPAGQELATCKNSVPNQLQLQPQYQIGVIAGTFNFIPFGYYLFGEANDSAVSVSSTKTNIMKDFLTVPVSHSFIMDNNIVQWQIMNFFNDGKFKHQFYNCLRKNKISPYCISTT